MQSVHACKQDLMAYHAYGFYVRAGYQERPTQGDDTYGLLVQTRLIAKLSLEQSLPRYYLLLPSF